ncbi:hypothetical protein MMC25_006759 [Agyrium rufum]|nr:hypothetical protein [Agyrium rufum]
MYTTILTSTFLLASSALAQSIAPAATAPISLSPQQSQAVVSDVEAYQQSLQEDPAFQSIALVLATALPSTVLEEILTNPAGFFQEYATVTSEPAWLAALPTDVQGYLASVEAAEVSIINKDAGSASGMVTSATGAAGSAVSSAASSSASGVSSSSAAGATATAQAASGAEGKVVKMMGGLAAAGLVALAML